MRSTYYWNPMRELEQAQQQFAAFLNAPRPQAVQPQNGQQTWTPAVDVSETADGYVFAVELPGVNPEAVDVELKDNTLTIKGERANRAENEHYHYSERLTGRFARVFRLSKPVNSEGVSAAYRDGVLSVTVPLREEAKPRKIAVQA